MLTAKEPLPAEFLYAFLDRIKAHTYRIKGFARVEDGIVYISGMKNHLQIEPWTGAFSGTEIVVISAVGIQIVSRITKELDGELKDKIKIGM